MFFKSVKSILSDIRSCFTLCLKASPLYTLLRVAGKLFLTAQSIASAYLMKHLIDLLSNPEYLNENMPELFIALGLMALLIVVSTLLGKFSRYAETMQNDMTCAFVVKEEIGCRGAIAAAFNSKADAVLVLEGTTAGDMGVVPEVRQVCRVGKGVAVSFMDNGSIATRKLYKQVLDIAEKNNCHYQIKEGVAGGNDASAYQGAADAKATCVLSVPCRYIHGPSSVIKLSDVDDQLCLARAVVNSL